MLDLSARLLEGRKELKVVSSLIKASLDLLLKLKESWKIRTLSLVKDLDDLVKLGHLKSLSENIQVCSSSAPIGNFIKRTLNSVACGTILIRDKLLDLSSPVNDS